MNRPKALTIPASHTYARGMVTLGINLLLAFLFAAALFITSANNTPAWVPFASTDQPAPAAAAPTWTRAMAARFPGCTGRVVLADTVVVVRLSGDVERMSFDEAWGRSHNGNPADDVWVVGSCA